MESLGLLKAPWSPLLPCESAASVGSILLEEKASEEFLLHLLPFASAPKHIIPTYQAQLLHQCLERLIY